MIREHVKTTPDFFLLPVVTETYDGYLNDIGAKSITPEMTVRGIETASADTVPEGNTGGGTGMICSGFKAGTGSSSRIIKGSNGEEFVVATLAQVNFGKKDDLTFCGVPVGRLHNAHIGVTTSHKKDDTMFNSETVNDSIAAAEKVKEGSIIVIIATSAPLTPLQLQRLAKRATVGVARLGGWGGNTSGDVFLAFSTGLELARDPQKPIFKPAVEQGGPVVLDTTINALFEGAADSTEEAIMNSICMAQDTEGPEGHRMAAIDQEWLKQTMEKHYVSAAYTSY